MHLVPLFCVAGVMILDQLKYAQLFQIKIQLLIITGLSFALIFASRWLIYVNKSWQFPPWFANLIFNSPDSIYYVNPAQPLLWFLVISLSYFFYIYIKKKKSLNVTHSNSGLLILFCAVTLIWQTLIFSNALKRSLDDTLGSHGREIANLIETNIENGDSSYIVGYQIPGMNSVQLHHALLFWDIPINAAQVIELDSAELKDIQNQLNAKNVFYVSGSELHLPIVGSYSYNSEEVYVYQIK